jgi:DoxX-like family
MNTRKVGYWAATVPLALILFGSGAGALTRQDFLVEAMTGLGFPLYVMRILGTSYVLAAIALVVPAFPWVKEWAYAGVVFAMTAAFASHVFSADPFSEHAMPVVILSLAVASYVLRPASRRLVVRTPDDSLLGAARRLQNVSKNQVDSRGLVRTPEHSVS